MLIKQEGICFRKWPVKKAAAVILAVHGMGAHSERWDFMAKYLKAKKIAVYAIALRGFGEISGDKPGHVDSMDIYSKDIAVLKGIIKAENKGVPVFIAGESMGALIAHMTVLDFDSGYKGLIEIAPVYKDVMKMSLAKRANVAITGMFNPSKAIHMPFTAEELTRDNAVVKKIKADKREHRLASAGLLVQILLRELKVSLTEGRIHIPVLFLLAGKDMLGDTKYNLMLFDKIKAKKELHLYHDSYHALSIEKNRNEVFSDLYKWVKKILDSEF